MMTESANIIGKELLDKKKFEIHTKLKNIKVGDCKWTTGFWADKFKVCEDIMVPYMGDVLCGDVGHALNNFKIAAGEKEGEHQGMYWHDGDFYKFLEAMVYVYAHNKDENLLKQLDEHIEIIGRAQEEDGYLQTQIQLRDDADRYENRKYHEMYNTGHLLLTACAHYNVTGKTNFLNIALKHADLLHTIFMPETKHFGRFGFNQTQIMGLVKLYRTVGDRKYLELAERFINNRGKYDVEHHSTTEGYPIGDMVQERTALRDATEPVGHAVLALYYYAGATDLYAETGEQALIDALDRLWESVTNKKMYVTGAVGQTHYGASKNRDMIEEGFIDDYMMPNMTAYNETCANLCNAMFSYRMLGVKAESKYADIIELVMYNSALSGISLSGTEYFYANPLRMVNDTRDYDAHADVTETPERKPYLHCFCCPPNLVRTIARVSEWAYNLSDNGLAVNLFGSSVLETKLLDGSTIKVTQETNYPWEGVINLTVNECKEESFDIMLRIPGWASEATVLINGEKPDMDIVPGQYAVINRKWNKGDVITLGVPMETHFVEGHPRIEEVKNQVAIKRGPVVYCIESPDLPKDTSILDVYINGKTPLEIEHKPDFLGGVTTVTGELLLRETNKSSMYSTITAPKWQAYQTNFVPYFAWSNRGQAEMTVFMPVVW